MNNLRNRNNLSIVIILFTTFLLSCKNSNAEAEKATSKDNTIAVVDSTWVKKLTHAYRTLDKGKTVEAADQLIEAADLMPRKNWEIYFVAASIYTQHQKNDNAFKALHKAVEFGLRDLELLQTYQDLATLKHDERWNDLLLNTKKAKQDYLASIQNPEVLKTLELMWAKDQQALSQYEENIKDLDSNAPASTYRKLFKNVEEQWEKNKNKLDSIIKIHGWPGYTLVGEDGAKLSWAIPQHHPDVFFKERCLDLIKDAVTKGDADPNHVAELTDRIARETWQKQTYGASMRNDTPYPIKDPANVDKRRLELGLLEPIEVYAYYHGITYVPPSEEEAAANAKRAYAAAQEDYKQFEAFAKAGNADSANVYIKKAIESYGDISNQQLYDAAVTLAGFDNDYSKRMSFDILKVLIWRKWQERSKIKKEDAFDALRKENQWKVIEALLNKSMAL